MCWSEGRSSSGKVKVKNGFQLFFWLRDGLESTTSRCPQEHITLNRGRVVQESQEVLEGVQTRFNELWMMVRRHGWPLRSVQRLDCHHITSARNHYCPTGRGWVSLTPSTHTHTQLEKTIAEWKQKKKTLLNARPGLGYSALNVYNLEWTLPLLRNFLIHIVKIAVWKAPTTPSAVDFAYTAIRYASLTVLWYLLKDSTSLCKIFRKLQEAPLSGRWVWSEIGYPGIPLAKFNHVTPEGAYPSILSFGFSRKQIFNEHESLSMVRSVGRL